MKLPIKLTGKSPSRGLRRNGHSAELWSDAMSASILGHTVRERKRNYVLLHPDCVVLGPGLGLLTVFGVSPSLCVLTAESVSALSDWPVLRYVCT